MKIRQEIVSVAFPHFVQFHHFCSEGFPPPPRFDSFHVATCSTCNASMNGCGVAPTAPSARPTWTGQCLGETWRFHRGKPGHGENIWDIQQWSKVMNWWGKPGKPGKPSLNHPSQIWRTPDTRSHMNKVKLIPDLHQTQARSVSTESGTLKRSALKKRKITGWTSNCAEEFHDVSCLSTSTLSQKPSHRPQKNHYCITDHIKQSLAHQPCSASWLMLIADWLPPMAPRFRKIWNHEASVTKAQQVGRMRHGMVQDRKSHARWMLAILRSSALFSCAQHLCRSSTANDPSIRWLRQGRAVWETRSSAEKSVDSEVTIHEDSRWRRTSLERRFLFWWISWTANAKTKQWVNRFQTADIHQNFTTLKLQTTRN